MLNSLATLNKEPTEMETRTQVHCDAAMIMEFYQEEDPNLRLNHNLTNKSSVWRTFKSSINQSGGHLVVYFTPNNKL